MIFNFSSFSDSLRPNDSANFAISQWKGTTVGDLNNGHMR